MEPIALDTRRANSPRLSIDLSGEDMSMMIDQWEGTESNGGRVSGSERGEGDGASSTTSSPSWLMSALPALTHARTLRSCLSTSGSSTMISTPDSSPACSSVSSLPSFGPFSKPTCSHASHPSTSSQGAKSVSFADHPPECFETWEDDAYDRSPHPVVIRLSYRDVLELREMKVELGIVTKRQAMGSSATDGRVCRGAAAWEGGGARTDSTAPETLMQRRLAGGTLNLNLAGMGAGDAPPGITPEEDRVRGYQPPSPSVFPSSPFLVSQLQRLPHPQPPARATGVGMSVQTPVESRSVGRQRSGSHGSSRLSRKTSMDSMSGSPTIATHGQQEEEESEFQRELRQAKEELDILAIKEMRDKEMLGRGRTETPKPAMLTVATSMPPRAASTAEARRAARLLMRRAASSRSAAFFEHSVQTLTPPGKSAMVPGRSARLPLRLIPDDEPRVSPPSISEAEKEDKSDATPLNLGVRRGNTPIGLQVPRSASGDHLLPLHSPLPERDVSPIATPGDRDDSAVFRAFDTQTLRGQLSPDPESSIRDPTTPTGLEDRDASSTSTTPIARASLPPRRSMSPLRSQPACQALHSSFFDRVETIAAPFTVTQPAIEVEQR